MAEKQQSLFSRGAKLEKLRRAVLPAAPGVSAKCLLAVLRCIDDHARDQAEWVLSEEKIARWTGYSVAQVERALKVLHTHQLMLSTRRYDADGHRIASKRRIVWSNLEAEALTPDPLPEGEGGAIGKAPTHHGDGWPNHHGAPPNHHGAPPNHHGAPPNHHGAPPNHHGDGSLKRLLSAHKTARGCGGDVEEKDEGGRMKDEPERRCVSEAGQALEPGPPAGSASQEGRLRLSRADLEFKNAERTFAVLLKHPEVGLSDTPHDWIEWLAFLCAYVAEYRRRERTPDPINFPGGFASALLSKGRPSWSDLIRPEHRQKARDAAYELEQRKRNQKPGNFQKKSLTTDFTDGHG